MTGPAGVAGPVAADGTTRRRPRLDWSDDRGQVGGLEVLPFGFLVFVVGTLLVTNAWAVVDVKLAVNAATREGVRAVVEAPDAATAARRGPATAREAIAAHGRDPGRLTVEAVAYEGGRWRPCARATVRASYPVPLVSIPLLGSAGRAFTVSSAHDELVDPYRSGTTTERVRCG